MTPAPLPDREVERALVVTAHPDDVDFDRRDRRRLDRREDRRDLLRDHRRAGRRLRPLVDRADIPDIRHREQRAAAKAVGVQDVRFLGYVDGEPGGDPDAGARPGPGAAPGPPPAGAHLEPGAELERLAPSHPDHLAGGEGRDPGAVPGVGQPVRVPPLEDEGLEAWSASEVWLMETPTDNHVVDVTEHFEAKMAALLCHESQHPDPERIRRAMHDKFTATAVEHGLAEGRLGEKFAVYRLP